MVIIITIITGLFVIKIFLLIISIVVIVIIIVIILYYLNKNDLCSLHHYHNHHHLYPLLMMVNLFVNLVIDFIKTFDDIKIEGRKIIFTKDEELRTVFINHPINFGIIRMFVFLSS
jgi:hypothetical protein